MTHKEMTWIAIGLALIAATLAVWVAEVLA